MTSSQGKVAYIKQTLHPITIITLNQYWEVTDEHIGEWPKAVRKSWVNGLWEKKRTP